MKNEKIEFIQNAIPLAQRALDSTMLLVTEDANDKPLSFGSGFFVGNNLIATNLHVVHGAEKCFAKLFSQKTMYEIEGYTAIDPENDLIILKVRDIDKLVPTLNLSSNVSIHIGEAVYAIGNPKGYEGTVSNGIVSGIRDTDKLIQMTAPISHGSSGGPVINSNGEVIGVSVLSRSDGQNLNFAIPAVYVKKLITDTEEHNLRPLLLAKLEGVKWVNEELIWLETEHTSNTYKFTLLNQRRYRAIREIHCLVIFRDERKKPIHLDFVKFPDEIPARGRRTILRSSMFDLVVYSVRLYVIFFLSVIYFFYLLNQMERSLQMGKRIHHLREVSEIEAKALRELSKSRTQPYRRVQRAKLLVHMIDDETLTASKAAKQVGFKSGVSGAHWVNRFNEAGLEGLTDKPRSGKPDTHSQQVRSRVIDLALRKPRELGYPFELWTLKRLQSAFKEREGIHLSDSTIWEWLRNEGLRWKRQQSWFADAEKHDEAFVEKRGPL